MAVGVLLAAAGTIYFARSPSFSGDAAPVTPVDGRPAERRDVMPALQGTGESPGPSATSPESPTVPLSTEQVAELRDAEPGEIRLRVIHEGKPVPGAVVRARPVGDDLRPTATWSTDEEGILRLEIRPLKSSFVEVLAPGFVLERMWGEHLWIGSRDVELRTGVEIHGRVVDAYTGRPVAGARVLVEDSYLDFEVEPTDEEGRFHVPGVRDDHTAEVRVLAAGYAESTSRVDVRAGKVEPGPPSIALLHGGAILGTVLSADGTPVPEAVVMAFAGDEVPGGDDADPEDPEAAVEGWIGWEEGWDADRKTVSGSDGSFRLDGVPLDRPFTLIARARGHAGSLPTVARLVQGGPDAPLRIALRRPATVVVTLRAPDGTVIAGHPVVRLFQRGFLRKAFEEVPGPFRFEDLDPGPSFVHVRADPLRPVVRRVDVVEGNVQELEVVLAPGATVEGLVVDVEGTPVAGARVQVGAAALNPYPTARHVWGEQSATSDAAGRFSVTGVSGGPVVLLALAKDEDGEVVLGLPRRLELVAPVRDLRVVLEPRGRLRVRLVTPDGSPFVGDLSGWVWRRTPGEEYPDPFGRRDVMGSKDGVVLESDLDDGPYELLLEPTGFVTLVLHTEIRRGAPLDLGDRTVDRGIEVTGRVLDASQRPVVAAQVDVRQASRRVTWTDEEGRFALPRMPREAVEIQFRAYGFVMTSAAMDPSRPAGLEVVLRALPRVRGTVRWPDGRVAAGATLSWWLRGYERLVRADAEGRFDIRLDAAPYQARWEDATGTAHVVGEWTFAAGEERSVEIVLPAR